MACEKKNRSLIFSDDENANPRAGICLSPLNFSADSVYLKPLKNCSRKYSIYSKTSMTRNTDGSFTMANSNSFLSPYEILPIAQ